ncbi:MAG TPA: hypothetical protein VFN28_09420 [Amaricoccus sp.]|nr:hypothetical protein [Amaricoccus sp.]
MSPGEDREHSAPEGGAFRPGGGTYPVRAAASAQQQPPPAAPARAPTPRVRPARPPRRGSPGGAIALVLGALALLTLVLLVVSLGGYLPQAPEDAEPAAAEPADGGAAAPSP